MEYRGVSELNGSYKLSENLILRMISRKIECLDGSIADTISNKELLTIIYFSQICDISGTIPLFKASELSNIIGCSIRSTYNILSNLENKGFINLSKTNWTGYRTIVLNFNDFSQVNFDSAPKYLNTNFTYLNPLHEDYQEFKKLSLYAKKLLLVILLKYQQKYGYRVSLDTLRGYLGVCNKPKILKYIKELEMMFDSRVFKVTGSKIERLKNKNLHVSASIPHLSPSHGIEEQQLCYFKHKIINHLTIKNIECVSHYSHVDSPIMATVHKLYSMVISYVSKGLSSQIIEDTIISISSRNGVLDELSIVHIDNELNYSLKKCG